MKTTIEEVGRIATILASDADMTVTGSTVYADTGFHVMA
ncbi:SDR family oxidoreductase [Paraburkholderia sp. RL17-337-BIB-A]